MLDLNKSVRLSDGRKARIICTDFKGRWPIVLVVPQALHPNEDMLMLAKPCGTIQYWPGFLENIPEPRTVWMNIYPGTNENGIVYLSKAKANEYSLHHRQHLLEINIDTGETKKHEV